MNKLKVTLNEEEKNKLRKDSYDKFLLMFGFIYFFEPVQTVMSNPSTLNFSIFMIYLSIFILMYRFIMSISNDLNNFELHFNKAFNKNSLYLLPFTILFIFLIVVLILILINK